MGGCCVEVDIILSLLPSSEEYWERISFEEIWSLAGRLTEVDCFTLHQEFSVHKKRLDSPTIRILIFIESRLYKLHQDPQFKAYIDAFCQGSEDAYSDSANNKVARQLLELTFIVHYCLDRGMLSLASINAAKMLADAFYQAFKKHDVLAEKGIYYNRVAYNSINHQTFENEAFYSYWGNTGLQSGYLSIPPENLEYARRIDELEQAKKNKAQKALLIETEKKREEELRKEAELKILEERRVKDELRIREEQLKAEQQQVMITLIDKIRDSIEFTQLKEVVENLSPNEPVNPDGRLFLQPKSFNNIRKKFDRLLTNTEIDKFDDNLRKFLSSLKGVVWQTKDKEVQQIVNVLAKKLACKDFADGPIAKQPCNELRVK